MENRYLDDLEAFRELLVARRRGAAEKMNVEMFLQAVAAIEAVDKALAEELKTSERNQPLYFTTES